MTYHIFLDHAGRMDATEQFGMYLIVEAETGVVYRHQCGGSGCEKREAEGFLVPIGGHKDAQPFTDFFNKEFENDYPLVIPWTEAQIKKLRFLVRTMPHYEELDEEEPGFGPYDMRLDETRMAECTEAWIPVTTTEGNAILIFENYD